MPIAISRHPEAMYVRFTNLPYAVSLEIADNFVVDFSPDKDIIGLEILWDEAYRIDSEPALLAFGIFSAAVVWLGYHRANSSEEAAHHAVLRKTKRFIRATELPLQINTWKSTGLTVTDATGQLLLCADVQDYHRPILRPANERRRTALSETKIRQMEPICSPIDRLRQRLADDSCAVGITVSFVDDGVGISSPDETVSPGHWVTWPEMPRRAWAHIAIIPPADRAYPWLPESFIR